MANLSAQKIKKLRNGQVYYRVWGWPVSDANAGAWARPCPRIDGVHFHIDRHEVRKLGDKPSGSVMSRYFSNEKSAQKFLDEVFAGFHPQALVEAIEWSEICDEMDAAFSCMMEDIVYADDKL